jgi:hypothetical protein
MIEEMISVRQEQTVQSMQGKAATSFPASLACFISPLRYELMVSAGVDKEEDRIPKVGMVET